MQRIRPKTYFETQEEAPSHGKQTTSWLGAGALEINRLDLNLLPWWIPWEDSDDPRRYRLSPPEPPPRPASLSPFSLSLSATQASPKDSAAASFASGLSCAPAAQTRRSKPRQAAAAGNPPNPPPPSGYVGDSSAAEKQPGLPSDALGRLLYARGGVAAGCPDPRPGGKAAARGVRNTASSRLSPMRMRICFLPKRREKSEEMVRPMAAGALRRKERAGWRWPRRRGGRQEQATRTPVPPARFLFFAAFLSGWR